MRRKLYWWDSFTACEGVRGFRVPLLGCFVSAVLLFSHTDTAVYPGKDISQKKIDDRGAAAVHDTIYTIIQQQHRSYPDYMIYYCGSIARDPQQQE